MRVQAIYLHQNGTYTAYFSIVGASAILTHKPSCTRRVSEGAVKAAHTHLEIHCQVRGEYALLELCIGCVRGTEVRNGLLRLSVVGKREAREVLQQANEEERHLVVCELGKKREVSIVSNEDDEQNEPAGQGKCAGLR